jgi:hypothetical protein
MSVDNQKLFQKIVEELESLWSDQLLSIAISCLFSEMPSDSVSKVRVKFTKAVNELNTLKPAAAPSRRRSRQDVYSKALSMMTKPRISASRLLRNTLRASCVFLSSSGFNAAGTASEMLIGRLRLLSSSLSRRTFFDY